MALIKGKASSNSLIFRSASHSKSWTWEWISSSIVVINTTPVFLWQIPLGNGDSLLLEPNRLGFSDGCRVLLIHGSVGILLQVPFDGRKEPSVELWKVVGRSIMTLDWVSQAS